jgi:hypothetical protein
LFQQASRIEYTDNPFMFFLHFYSLVSFSLHSTYFP